MRDLELLPCHHPPSAYLVWLHLESAVFVMEQVGLLCIDAWQYPHNCPREEPTICSSVAPIKERVLLLGVAMDVTVDPDLSPLNLRKVLE